MGDRKKYLKKTIKEISSKHLIVCSSSLYENPPWRVDNIEGEYINMVLKISTTFSPNELMDDMNQIEFDLGRENKNKKLPRTIDIDLLLYEDKIINTKTLTIPHPLMHIRSFVLIPLNEIDSQTIHPIEQKTIGELLKTLPYHNLKKL